MKRIVLAGIKQETATFNPVPTCYRDFHTVRGEEVLSRYAGTRTEIAGAASLIASLRDYRLVPAWFSDAVPGGAVPAEDLDRLTDELVEAVSLQAPTEGVLLVLHGAMAGTAEPDPEGRILSRVRRVVGEARIVASVDLHAVLTDRMVESADLLVPFHTYPHTDLYETGQRAAAALIRLLEQRPRICTERVKLPMLVRGDELLTATGLFGRAMRDCAEVEKNDAGLSAGVLIGNPFTDVPDLRSNVLVSTAGDPGLARESARRIAEFMWEHRRSFTHRLVPLADAIRQAETASGLTVFSDAADATSSGAPGDSNAILRGLLELGYGGRALVPIVDRPAVDAAFAAGDGASISVSLGGTLDPERHAPVEVSARVLRLSRGGVVYEDGTREPPLRAAVFGLGTHAVLATERPLWFVGLAVFRAFGLDPIEFDLVVVKSPNGFRTHYGPVASLILCVDVPGATSADLRTLPYLRCPRPMYPLDEDQKMEPGR